MNNILLLPVLVMLIEGKAPPTGCDIVNWSPPMKGLTVGRFDHNYSTILFLRAYPCTYLYLAFKN